jgi:hypothetical protein
VGPADVGRAGDIGVLVGQEAVEAAQVTPGAVDAGSPQDNEIWAT